MSASQKPVNISILDKEYLIGCTEDEREALIRSAEFLNMKIKEVKDSGKIIGSERIAVMAALNITHELLAYKQQNDSYNTRVDTLIRRLQNKIDDALTQGKQMEIQ